MGLALLLEALDLNLLTFVKLVKVVTLAVALELLLGKVE